VRSSLGMILHHDYEAAIDEKSMLLSRAGNFFKNKGESKMNCGPRMSRIAAISAAESESSEMRAPQRRLKTKKISAAN
jgi:hypothetical protein